MVKQRQQTDKGKEHENNTYIHKRSWEIKTIKQIFIKWQPKLNIREGKNKITKYANYTAIKNLSTPNDVKSEW